MESHQTARVLIVANRTASTPRLIEAVRRRAEASPCDFALLIPDVIDRKEADWTLETAQRLLRPAARGTVEGLVGGPDPFESVKEAVHEGKFDEIIISTLPERISQWLRMDLVRRVSRKFEMPITTVIGTANDELLPPAERLVSSNAPEAASSPKSNGKRVLMGESVYKIIELVGTSTDSWEKAAAAAVTKASKTLRDLRVAEIAQLDLVIDNGVVSAYRAKVKVSFKYEGE
jgi:flavin-binding protein dodecin